jgi:hypothetical protein
MRKPFLGALVGTGLGLFDGLSAWAVPEARPILALIVVGSTLKGLLTGLVSGLVALRTNSLLLGISIGIIAGAALSSLAAIGQSAHYWTIVLPGMLLGAITGFVTQRFGHSTASTLRSVVAAILLLSSVPGFAQTPELPPDLAPLKFFLGKWVGTSEGQPGKGTAEREYRTLLRSRVVELSNRNVYPPQPSNVKGETHEDIGIFSFDRAAKKIRFRQFHVEGFVVEYSSAEANEKTLAFVSESIENIPIGYRSKETYVILGPDEFEEIFELAEAGKDFQVYSRTRLKRVK